MGWQDWFKGGSGQRGTSADTRADRDPSWNQNGSNSGITEGTGGFAGGHGSTWGRGADSGGGYDRIPESGRDDRNWTGGQSGGDGWGYGGGIGGSSGGGDTWGTPGRDPWSNPSRDPYNNN